MPTMTKVDKPKVAGFVDRGYNHARKQAKMEAEEKEIARLEALARGEEVSDEDEEEPNGEGLEATQVQDADDTKQEETAEPAEEDEAQEDDSKLSAEEKSFKKRYGDLRRYMQKKEKEWEEKFEKLSNSSAPVRAPKSDEDIEQWAKEYPDVASLVETIATKKAKELFDQADARLQAIDELTREAEVTKAEAKIRKAHSDFDDLRASDEFHNWAEEQPKWVQDALYENMDDPASVIRVIDLYKVDMGLTKTAAKAKTKSAAAAIKAKASPKLDADETAGTIKESDVAKMSADEFEKNMDKITKAQQSGKFIYDISGRAR